MRPLFLAALLFACSGGSQKSCTTTSCSGCCTEDDRCIVEVRERDTWCGFNGATCLNCTSQGKTCSTVTQSCQ